MENPTAKEINFGMLTWKVTNLNELDSLIIELNILIEKINNFKVQIKQVEPPLPDNQEENRH